MANHGDYELAGYRLEGGEWHDVEDGAPLPNEDQWGEIDLVTINLSPGSEDGFYRSANLIDGFDAAPEWDWEYESDLYTLDDLAAEMADAYGFASQ